MEEYVGKYYYQIICVVDMMQKIKFVFFKVF